MKSTTWSLVWLVVTGCSGAATLDKNGTSGSQNDPMFTKMPEKQEPAEAGSFLTEREGDSLGFVAIDGFHSTCGEKSPATHNLHRISTSQQ